MLCLAASGRGTHSCSHGANRPLGMSLFYCRMVVGAAAAAAVVVVVVVVVG